MRTHFVKVEWDGGGITYAFRCAAPAESLCHARWSCDCEAFEDEGVEDGRPWHTPWGEVTTDDRHYGSFDPTVCNWKDWFEADYGTESMQGSIEVPVRGEWEPDVDGFLFYLDPEPSGVVQPSLDIEVRP